MLIMEEFILEPHNLSMNGWWLISFYVYYVGNWKRGKRDGYGVQESYGKLAGGGDGWLTTVLDGSWKQDKFHGWGRMLEFEEIDELLGLASGIESNLRYEGKVYWVNRFLVLETIGVFIGKEGGLD